MQKQKQQQQQQQQHIINQHDFNKLQCEINQLQQESNKRSSSLAYLIIKYNDIVMENEKEKKKNQETKSNLHYDMANLYAKIKHLEEQLEQFKNITNEELKKIEGNSSALYAKTNICKSIMSNINYKDCNVVVNFDKNTEFNVDKITTQMKTDSQGNLVITII